MTTNPNHGVKKFQEILPLIPVTLYLLGFLLLVIIYLIGLSFSAEGGNGQVFSLTHYSEIFSNEEFWAAWRNTVLFVIVGTPSELFIGFFFAVLIYSSEKGKKMIRSIFIVPFAIPAIVIATIIYILFDYPTGHINSFLMGEYPFIPRMLTHPINWKGSAPTALGICMLGKIWRDMPITMLIILSGLNAINKDLFDVAKTLGAGLRVQLLHIIIPSILPAISAVLLLRSIEMWKEFIFPFIVARQYNMLGTFIESLYQNWGYTNQAAVVALILVTSIVCTLGIIFYLMKILTRFSTDIKV